MHDKIELLSLPKELDYIPILHGKSGQLPLPHVLQERKYICNTVKKRKGSGLVMVGKGLLLLAGWWAVVSMLVVL